MRGRSSEGPGPRRGEPAGDDEAPRPPRQRRAFSTWHGHVEGEGDPAEVEALRALVRVDEEANTSLTHGFHAYAARMPPSLARGVVARWSRPGDVVLDPFCGSGTVLVESYAAGRRAWGGDASPLAVMLSETRTTTLGVGGRGELVAAAEEIATASLERVTRRQKPALPNWSAPLRARYFPHVLLELLGLRELVFAADEAPPITRALRLGLSSIVTKFARSGPAAPRDGANKRIAPGLPSRVFRDRARDLASGLSDLERLAPPGTPSPIVRLGDARAYPHVAAGSASLVLTSPPYAGVYDYAEQHDVRYRWLGLDEGGFRAAQIGARGQAAGASAEPWARDRERWLGEIGRVLRPGGHAVLVVGDGIVGEAPEDAASATVAAGRSAGLEPVARVSQDRPPLDRRVAELFGARPRREHVLLLRRS